MLTWLSRLDPPAVMIGIERDESPTTDTEVLTIGWLDPMQQNIVEYADIRLGDDMR